MVVYVFFQKNSETSLHVVCQPVCVFACVCMNGGGCVRVKCVTQCMKTSTCLYYIPLPQTRASS